MIPLSDVDEKWKTPIAKRTHLAPNKTLVCSRAPHWRTHTQGPGETAKVTADKTYSQVVKYTISQNDNLIIQWSDPKPSFNISIMVT